jgi:hypothetical protein
VFGLLWNARDFFHFTLFIYTEMPRRDLTLADKTALLEQIKNQPPDTSHRQLVEIIGVPKSTVAHVIQMQKKLGDELDFTPSTTGTFPKTED